MSPRLWQLENFVEKNRLPLYFTHVRSGDHPQEQYHDHNSSEIVIILGGKAEHIVKTGKQIFSSPVSPGDLLVVHPGAIHAYKNTETLELINLVYGYEAVIDCVNGLGGVYIDVDSEEIKHINNYQKSILRDTDIDEVLPLFATEDENNIINHQIV